MPVFDLTNLLECLELSSVSPGEYEGKNLDMDYRRVFGGQILGQVVSAAADMAPGKTMKSMSMLFPREGDTSLPMQYRVDAHQVGRTFGTLAVTGHQDGRVVAAAVVSMHIGEPGLDRNDPLPDGVGSPADAVRVDLGMVPWETRIVGGVDLAASEVGPPELLWWQRADDVPDTQAAHQALLAHSTDLTVIGTALRPFDGISQAQSTVGLHTAVTSHSIWFHRPVRLSDWLLVAQRSPVVAGARAFGRGDVFTETGELVASFAQESMIRQIES